MTMLRPLGLNIVGASQHRSGWPYCMNALKPLFSKQAPVLLDDFVERSFLYSIRLPEDFIHTDPWVGIFHHPPDIPRGYFEEMHLQKLEDNHRWRSSKPQLRLAISLGDYLTDWWKERYPEIPVATLYHPTGRPSLQWTPERFRRNQQKQLVQIGWFLRNLMAIYQVEPPTGFTKTHLRQHRTFITHAENVCREKQSEWYPGREYKGSVKQIAEISDIEYDLLLAENVVVIEIMSAVANNTVVECIARNTPICINRHDGPRYYLGDGYPLFFEDLDQVPYLLTEENILAAHHYLKTLDKWWIRGGMFFEQVRQACLQHVPECQQEATLRRPTLFSI